MSITQVGLGILVLALIAVLLASTPLLQQAPALLQEATSGQSAGQAAGEAAGTPLERAEAAQKAAEKALDDFRVAVEEGTRDEAEAALAEVERQKEIARVALQQADRTPQYNEVAEQFTDISLQLDWARGIFRGRYGNQ